MTLMAYFKLNEFSTRLCEFIFRSRQSVFFHLHSCFTRSKLVKSRRKRALYRAEQPFEVIFPRRRSHDKSYYSRQSFLAWLKCSNLAPGDQMWWVDDSTDHYDSFIHYAPINLIFKQFSWFRKYFIQKSLQANTQEYFGFLWFFGTFPNYKW